MSLLSAFTTSAAPGPSQSGVSIDSLLADITSAGVSGSPELAHHLKNYGAKETRELIFASLLQSGQDPLTVLDVQNNTLGYLYLLCVTAPIISYKMLMCAVQCRSARLSVVNAPMPSIPQIKNFCQGFDPQAARFAPERS